MSRWSDVGVTGDSCWGLMRIQVTTVCDCALFGDGWSLLEDGLQASLVVAGGDSAGACSVCSMGVGISPELVQTYGLMGKMKDSVACSGACW